MDEQLADRIVVRADGTSGVRVRIEPDAEPAGRNDLVDFAGARSAITLDVFGVDSAFDRKSAMNDVVLLDREFLAGGNTNLLLDEVDAGNHFGNGMLDLNSGVHLDEVVVPLVVDDKLDGASVRIFRRDPRRIRRALARFREFR